MRMRIEIIVPESAMPKKDPEHPCECQFRPFKLKDKKGEIFWLITEGEEVKKDQIICEGEVEKKTIEIPAPADGILAEISIQDEGSFTVGDILGYIETI